MAGWLAGVLASEDVAVDVVEVADPDERSRAEQIHTEAVVSWQRAGCR